MHTLAARFVVLCWFTFSVVWVVAAFSMKRTTARRGHLGQWWLLPVVAVTVLLFFLRRRQLGLLGVAPWSSSPEVAVVADVLAFGGLVIAVWARRTLGSLWSASPTIKEGQTVVETGPYRFVRHPIYSGVLLMMVGTVVLVGSPVGVVWFATALCGTWVKARREERLLQEFLPDAYAAYRARVRWALIPGVL
jgi:protein-S-isoprenylcysteine O-methyltransferase Ste14